MLPLSNAEVRIRLSYESSNITCLAALGDAWLIISCPNNLPADFFQALGRAASLVMGVFKVKVIFCCRGQQIRLGRLQVRAAADGTAAVLADRQNHQVSCQDNYSTFWVSLKH